MTLTLLHISASCLVVQWEQLEIKKNILVNKIKSKTKKFAQIIMRHKPEIMKGRMLYEIFPVKQRNPNELQKLFLIWQTNPELINTASPSLVFAVIGQAKSDGKISSESESKLLTKHLNRWAYWKSFNICAKKSVNTNQNFLITN
jgi:hypothetical protein